jgi:hypothetical protein
MSVKDEFKSAFEKHFGSWPTSEDQQNEVIMQGQYADFVFGARWAARWMAEYAANSKYCIFRDGESIRKTITDDSLRQLAKELE